MDQEDLDNPVLKTTSELFLSGAAEGTDLRTVDPETQARLEALLEAAGTFCSLFRNLTCIQICQSVNFYPGEVFTSLDFFCDVGEQSMENKVVFLIGVESCLVTLSLHTKLEKLI